MDTPSGPIGLVDGQFIDKDLENNIPGTRIPASFLNALLNEALNLLAAGGIEPEEADHTQWAQAVQAMIDAKPYLLLAGGQMTGSLGMNQGTNVNSASVLDLEDAATKGNFFRVLGTTNIDTISEGFTHSPLILNFAGILTLNHSASLVLPNAQNILTGAGDFAIFWRIAGVWTLISYMRADGRPLTSAALPYRGNVASVINGTDANHDIDFQIGAYQANDNRTIELTSVITKQIDASFVEGNNAGGHAGAALSANGTIHCFVIQKATGEVDAYVDSSLSAANRPSGFVRHAWVMSLRLNGSSDIIPFRQFGNTVMFDSRITDASGSSATTLALSVPAGIPVCAILASVHANSQNHTFRTPGTTGPQTPERGVGDGEGRDEVYTNESAQISVTNPAGTYSVYTLGYRIPQLAFGPYRA